MRLDLFMVLLFSNKPTANMNEKIKNTMAFDLEHGDLQKIRRIAGVSYNAVRRTLIYGTLKSKKIIDAARKVHEANIKLHQ